MSDSRLPSAFVTFGWCRSAYTVCRALHARGVRVHVGDSSAFAMTRFSRYCSSYSRLPNFFLSSSDYMDALIVAMRRQGATVLLPCSEDVEVVLRYRDRLPQGVHVALPDLDEWYRAEDKYEYLDIVGKAGCPVPLTRTVNDFNDLGEVALEIGFPLVVKVRNGNGSRGVSIVRDTRQLDTVFRKFVEEYELPTSRWPVLQQRIAGKKFQMDGVFVNGLYARDGVYSILRAKGSDLFGTSTYRVTESRPDIQSAASRALSALHWHGIFNLDWLCDNRGTPYLIDINGRLGGAVSILYEAGLDLPWLWYQLALGQSDLEMAEATPGVATKWLLGDMLALVEHLASGDIREALTILRPSRPRPLAYDDFLWRDPAPFFFELLDYLWKFISSRGSLRPTVKGMVR